MLSGRGRARCLGQTFAGEVQPMNTAAQAEHLAAELRTRRSAIAARRNADQSRLILSIRAIVRSVLVDASTSSLRAASALTGNDGLFDVLDDLERLSEAERSRLSAVAVHEHLQDPTRRAAALKRREEDAFRRVREFRVELERLDTDAFRWLRDRQRRRSRKTTSGERLIRAVSFAKLRERRAEDALRESLGHEGFDSAAAAYHRAEKGLIRAEAEAERVAHTRAAIEDLVEEHAELQERVRTEEMRRLRCLRTALEGRLVNADLTSVVRRAPPNLLEALAEVHAVEVRLRAWQDLEAALGAAIPHLEEGAARGRTAAGPDDLSDRVTACGALVPTMDRVVEILAAFHDFGGWAAALESGGDATVWQVWAGPSADELPADQLAALIPRLWSRCMDGRCASPGRGAAAGASQLEE